MSEPDRECPRCGSIDTTVLGEGTRPDRTRLVCLTCELNLPKARPLIGCGFPAKPTKMPPEAIWVK